MEVNRVRGGPTDEGFGLDYLPHCIMPGREGCRSQGTRTQGEQSNETCGQDVNPDGRFGLHVFCGHCSRASRRRWTDTNVQSSMQMTTGESLM